MRRLSVRMLVMVLGAVAVGVAVAAILLPLVTPAVGLVGATAIAVVAGIVAGALLGWLLQRWVLEPLRSLTRTTHAIATGDYRREVESGDAELAGLSTDVNALAAALVTNEERRVRLISAVAGEMGAPLDTLEECLAPVPIEDPVRRDRVDTELRRLRRLTGDLSILSRVEEGQLDLQRAEVDLVALAQRVVDEAEPEFGEAGVRLQALLPGRVRVEADPGRVREVLANLVENALRATRGRPSAEVLVGVARTTEDGRRVARLTVTDNGVGLSEEELTRVFERFYRAPGVRDTDGTGIGLTVARSIARAHGGDVSANSPGPERGATVTLTLPLVDG